ncbi:MAG TPA: DUF58 domain-containing protein [Candidatus Saccharimonadales bacterium]|nr:DUF58 domain-containing protein [Candidatus Saccharimonadales bacterium]
MIAPRSRLLFWVTAVVLPFALIGTVSPPALGISLLCIGGLLLVVLADAIGAGKSLAGIGVELPKVARMSKDREAKLEVRIRNERQRQRGLRVALAWPREIKAASETLDAQLPPQSKLSRLAWSCTPLRRGNYSFDAAYVEGSSPFGFWSVRKTLPVQLEIRVYPNLLTERKNVAAFFLNQSAFGVHAQRQVGKGRDFEKLREYIPGDDYNEIHWKATARRGKPITKVFQIEKTQEVYVILDASRLSTREVRSSKLKVQGSKPSDSQLETWNLEFGTSVLERFMTAALVLGLAAERQGDLFGLLTFSDKVEKFVRAKNGKAHYSACRDALYTLEPKIVTPDFDEVCTFIRLRLRRRALLVFLTALDDPALAGSFVRNMDLIRRQHLVLVNMLQMPGVNPLFTDAEVANVDDLYKQLGGHLQWQKLRELQKVLQRRGVQFSLLNNERLSAELVSQYLNVKQRQLL